MFESAFVTPFPVSCPTGTTKILLPVLSTAHRGKKRGKDFKVLALLRLLLVEEDFAALGLCFSDSLAVDAVEVVGYPFLI